MASSPTKRLPMIVDIAIDTNGKQMYQVHETSKLVRKEMPKSTSFTDSPAAQFEFLDEMSDKLVLPLQLHPAESAPQLEVSVDETTHSSPESSHQNTDNIWSDDVQAAFEEVLAIVPKNGLNKIKIAGRLCGRNELISDYILAKTGKVRSRKQVSSHIQVIKNMGQKQDVIRLINEGPTFASQLEMDEHTRHFEDVFAMINHNKLLGVNSVVGSGRVRRHLLAPLIRPKRARLPDSYVGVRNICFAIDNQVAGERPFVLSIQNGAPVTPLTVKDNAAISGRFPGLEEFSDSAVPVIHNMVRFFSPLQLPQNYSIEHGLRTSFVLELALDAQVSSFTTVFLFGTEVLKVNEPDFQPNTSQPFLVKFWKCFFLQLMHQPASLDAAYKGITVKQVIYSSLSASPHMIPKRDVRAVLLWEFAKTDDFHQATASTSRLFLPLRQTHIHSAPLPNYTPSMGNFVPQQMLNHSPLAQNYMPPMPKYSPLRPWYSAENTEPVALREGPVPAMGYFQMQPHMYHPSANVNLGSVHVKEEVDGLY